MKNDTQANSVVTFWKISEKAYAEINPEVWAAPGKYRKLDIEPLQITLSVRFGPEVEELFSPRRRSSKKLQL